jgi:hypothetical protein
VLLMQVLKFRLFIIFSITLILWSIGSPLGQTQEQEPAKGELRLEGKHIERLVLYRKYGCTEQFDEPDNTIKLAVGEYRLQDVRLKGGFISNSVRTSSYDWLTIVENEPAVLKVGAPLKQMLKVKRRGKALVLDYKLLGIGGESYNNTERDKPPKLIIYNGDEEINSGRFEYG